MQTALQTGDRSEAPRRSRAKRSLAWEELEIQTNGIYAIRLKCIAEKYPMLTPTQLRVAALVADLKPSFEIAGILGTSEHAIEKVRSRIRQKIGLTGGTSLCASLAAALE